MGLDISGTRRRHVIISDKSASENNKLQEDATINEISEEPEKINSGDDSSEKIMDMSSFMDMDFDESSTDTLEDTEIDIPDNEVNADEVINQVDSGNNDINSSEKPLSHSADQIEDPADPTVIKLKPEDVAIYKKPLTDDEINKLGNMDNITFKSGDVAERLGVSVQLVRNYSEQYDSILHVQKTPTGHRIFTEENIEQLKLILQLKQEKGLNTQQTIEFFQSKDKPLNKLTAEMKFDVLLQLISERVYQAMDEVLDKHSIKENEQLLLIEQYDKSLEKSSELISSLNDKIEMQQKEIEELRQLNEQQRSENKETLDEMNNLLKELLEKNEKTQKKGFLGLFK